MPPSRAHAQPSHKSDPVTSKFVTLATQISGFFPELDLRFNLQHGSSRLRYMIAGLSDEVYELEFDTIDIGPTLHEAVFTIKQLLGRFDD